MSDASHQQRTARKKAIVDSRIAAATEERGVLILLKGNGKGKSSSAFGMVARCVGHGLPCAVVQFNKGKTETGECRLFRRHALVDWYVMGHGFTWETQDRERDQQAAQQAWQRAQRLLADERYRLVVLDEMSYMFKYDYLPVAPVIEALGKRPASQNVVITGRTMARPLQDIADTISVVQDQRHAFRSGIKAQAGIEY